MKLEKSITVNNINSNLLNIKYAVRGAIVARAALIEQELAEGVRKPFKRVVYANIGDCHALGQKPVTFVRQVLALAACPRLMRDADVPQDVKERVAELLNDCTSGSVGAYSPSSGLRVVREHVAQYLSARDGGVPAHYEHVHLGSGASDLIKSVLTLMAGPVTGRPPAVMIPIPQYPLFSGVLSELGVHQAGYYLDEERSWELTVQELRRCWVQANDTHHVRALVVINPGNPTGQVLTRHNMEEVIRFAFEHRLFLLADEVYQENIVSKPFHSFKKVMYEMGDPYRSMELASFVTCSKGWVAECGLRAGFVELVGLQREVERLFVGARGVMQCPSVLGQCLLDCVVRPPVPGAPSHALFARELQVIRRVLSERTSAAHSAFSAIPGYRCNPIEGAMFAFPRIKLPQSACEAAVTLGLEPDEFYCLRLLEETGVCVVPGCGFGQRTGSYHLRTTILHRQQEFQELMDAFGTFHRGFLLQYT